jgi:hypothetical protein
MKKEWPESWDLPPDSAAIVFNADGTIHAALPQMDEDAEVLPDSPTMLAMVCMIATSSHMKEWRDQFVEEQFAKLQEEDPFY